MNTPLPEFYKQLMDQGCLPQSRIQHTGDGFCALTISLAELLHQKRIDTFPGDHGKTLECRYFFDDWFCYAVPRQASCTYGLFKLREQEQDAVLGLEADGDTPGVTVSFIAFHPEILLNCLADGSDSSRKALADEINRVVAWPGQKHDPVLKSYFLRPEAEGPYLMAELYVRHIASFAQKGCLPVPAYYEKIFQKSRRSRFSQWRRIPAFLEDLNHTACDPVCDHRQLFIRNLSEPEQLAILATHTGNTSFHAFAAEIRFHAMFLTPLSKIGIPFTGYSLYASALRADLSIKGSEYSWLYPYYNPHSSLVRKQAACHPSR